MTKTQTKERTTIVPFGYSFGLMTLYFARIHFANTRKPSILIQLIDTTRIKKIAGTQGRRLEKENL